MKSKLNPDDVIDALENVLGKYNVTLDVRRFTGDMVIYDHEGMEVCSFNKLTYRDGPTNLEIGHDYTDSYKAGSTR